MHSARTIQLDGQDLVVMTVVPTPRPVDAAKDDPDPAPTGQPWIRFNLDDKDITEDERAAWSVARAAIERIATRDHRAREAIEATAERAALTARLAELDAIEVSP